MQAFCHFLHQRSAAYILDPEENTVEVRHSLWLAMIPFPDLPDGLIVHGSLNIARTRVEALPHRLVVHDDLSIEGTGITRLPADITVGGSLYLSFSHIDALSDGFRVQGSLDVSNTQLHNLPEGLDVGGNLFLADTPLRCFPKDMRVGGIITPPPGLDDIDAFMQEHPDQDTIVLSMASSQHQKLQLHEQLHRFPDLYRVVRSVTNDGQLRLSQDATGKIQMRIERLGA